MVVSSDWRHRWINQTDRSRPGGTPRLPDVLSASARRGDCASPAVGSDRDSRPLGTGTFIDILEYEARTGMNFDEFTGQVQHRLELAETGEAVRAIRATLSTPGRAHPRGERRGPRRVAPNGDQVVRDRRGPRPRPALRLVGVRRTRRRDRGPTRPRPPTTPRSS